MAGGGVHAAYDMPRAPGSTSFEPAGAMAELWIVHRDAHVRAALARLAGGAESLVAGPADPRLEEAAPPRLVVLGVAGDFEAELELARRLTARTSDPEWILVAEPADLPDARRLFDGLGAEALAYPPALHGLRERIASALGRRRVDSLAARREREAVAARFARWFLDLAMPELLGLVDPRLADVPVLIAGEPGTGRGLLARYVHWFGARTAGSGSFVALPCGPETGSDVLLERLAAAGRGWRSGRVSVCLEEVDRLVPQVQREVREWIEIAPPTAALAGAPLRWIGTCCDPEAPLPGHWLDPELERALGGLAVRLPPLRRRREAIAALAEEVLAAWCRAHGERPRRLGGDALEALGAHPWPGNLREFEQTLVRSLAAERGDPLGAGQLRFEVGASPGTPRPEAVAEPGPPTAEVEAESVLEAFGPVDQESEPLASVEAEPEPPPGRVVEPESVRPVEPMLRRLAGAVAHEIRNPLTSIRTLAELLPERHADPEFRDRFARAAAADVARIGDVVERLTRLAALPAPQPERVDVAELLQQLLEERRARVEARRLLVLQELDREQPWAWADPQQLALAFEALMDRAVEFVPERGDLYLASKHHAGGLEGRPSVRVMLRFQRPPGESAPVPGLGLEETALELPVAEAVVRAQGGHMAVDASRGDEIVVLIDLPAPHHVA